MSNATLAHKIIDQHAEAEKIDGNRWQVTVPLIGYRGIHGNTKTEKFADHDRDGKAIKGGETTELEVYDKTTKADALDMAAAEIAKQLDAGDIVLSDEWADTNIS